MWSKAFWKAAFERVVWTIAQSALATIGVNGVAVGITNVDWLFVGNVAALAGVLSLIKSIFVNLGNGGEGPAINKNEIVVDVDSFDKNNAGPTS